MPDGAENAAPSGGRSGSAACAGKGAAVFGLPFALPLTVSIGSAIPVANSRLRSAHPVPDHRPFIHPMPRVPPSIDESAPRVRQHSAP